MKPKLLFCSTEKLHKDINSLVPEMIGAEVRALIQNWRKTNGLTIDQHIPTLKFYFSDPIFKTVFREGLSAVGEKKHFLELCLVDCAEFAEPPFEIRELCKDDDIIFWSPLGGTVGHGKVLTGNTKNLQKEIDEVIKKHLYNDYL